MKDKPISKAYKKFIRECCQKAVRQLRLNHYEINVHYMNDSLPKEDGYQTNAEMTVNRRYLAASMQLYPEVLEFWKEGNKNKVREIVFHEVAHILTQHLYDVGTATYRDEGEMKDAWESLTEAVSRLALELDDKEK